MGTLSSLGKWTQNGPMLTLPFIPDLQAEDLQTTNDDIRSFIRKTNPAAGQADKY